MTDDFSSVFEAPVDRPPKVDDLIEATMAWHFSPKTGSPYWVEAAKGFGFDPLKDVRTVADLRLFEGVSVDWSRIPADHLIPAGGLARNQRYGVYESGGTTGAPKRVVDADSRRRNVMWQSMLLDEQGFPEGGGCWLHIGPTGPHIMAKNVANLAAMRGFLICFIDLDPRWVRRCLSEGREQDFHAYAGHLMDQVRTVLETQDVRAVSSTPRILEIIATRPDIAELMRAKVRGIIWGGTSADAETLRLFRQEVFPGAVLAGAYGNTMMGVAPQRTARPGDPAPCIFRPFYPYSLVELVDPADPVKPVPDDTEGQVVVTTLTRDLFVPPTLERDVATRRASDQPGIELSGVRPRESSGSAIVEGVY